MSQNSDNLDRQVRQFKRRSTDHVKDIEYAESRIREADSLIFIDTRPGREADHHKLFTRGSLLFLVGAALVLGSFWVVGWILAGGLSQ